MAEGKSEPKENLLQPFPLTNRETQASIDQISFTHNFHTSKLLFRAYQSESIHQYGELDDAELTKGSTEDNLPIYLTVVWILVLSGHLILLSALQSN